ncbi:ABC transporter ATP-binding protein [Streptomyces sp. SP18CS02]|uniref:ABC transporter ATP-binding protein n=1 Tax=Streptomyces sp. SP18CS02 TaxID=3002531 RepID=UPI002E775BB4|nr:ATP-binding cassette domain-containing protein [Streptomyces sp. SP18CS02]MEE1756537.1 ATP-binding cassette domain-containing protein [Streptomyces sp. SP18CS02]
MNLRSVGRRYGPRGPWVLRDVRLDLPPGRLIRVQGSNGSGKSTLLRLIAGIDAPTEGRVTGRPGRTAYVPERFPAAMPLTATGYLVHLGRIQGLRPAVAAARAAEWLERFGAAAHARTPLAELSKGSSQKVAVAQALLAEPELLVLDEAWTGLDTAARAELERVVGERVAAGGTVVCVDHDPGRLGDAWDAVYAVHGGRVTRGRAGPDAEPRAQAEAVGAPVGLVRVVASGAPLPGAWADGLPGSPAYATGADGRVVFTVGAAHSDALLRELLTARPPWHIHRVGAAGPAANVPGTSR